ncbi:MAG: hypothetical protein ABIJ09_13325 [Pseudomonadota bacterium]
MAAKMEQRISASREELVETILRALQSSSARHYRGTELPVLAERVERLVDTFIESLHKDPARFVTYVRALAGERLAEGFPLREVQLALNLLGEAAWKVGAAGTELKQVVSDLGATTGIIGCAKDQLALIYLEQKEEAQASVVRLQGKLRELFGGTDAHELPDD